jgi:hypothetical protein
MRPTSLLSLLAAGTTASAQLTLTVDSSTGAYTVGVAGATWFT